MIGRCQPLLDERNLLNHAGVNLLLTQVEGLPFIWLIHTLPHLLNVVFSRKDKA
jgi:hypothetical protein